MIAVRGGVHFVFGAFFIASAGGACDAIRRNDPQACRSPVVTGCASTMMAHTANMAADTGVKIRLDDETGRLLNTEAEVTKLWSREYEKGWEPRT